MTAPTASGPAATGSAASADYLAQADTFGAHNYHPLPIVIASGAGAWVTDVEGRQYLDCLAAYSALNFGHRHPALVDAATRQLGRVTLTSRAFDHDLLHPFAEALASLVGPLTTGGADSLVLPMNTGAEAVETAIKTARKWGYDVRGVPPGEATVVVGSGNFHVRTTTIVSFSDDPDARRGFDPYTPGFRIGKRKLRLRFDCPFRRAT